MTSWFSSNTCRPHHALVHASWVEQVLALHPQVFPVVNNDNNGDDEDGDDGEPEEGVGVQVAGAHHDHVHLRCAPVLERGNLHTDDEGNDDGDDGGGDGDVDVENNHFTDGDAPISGRI